MTHVTRPVMPSSYSQAAFAELDCHNVGQLTSDDFVKVRNCLRSQICLLAKSTGCVILVWPRDCSGLAMLRSASDVMLAEFACPDGPGCQHHFSLH